MPPPLSQARVDFDRRYQRITTTLDGSRQRTRKKAAMVAKKTHADIIRRHSGGDSRLSGVGKRGARVGVRFDERGDRTVMRAVGPMQLLANPTKARRIPRKRGPRARRRVVVIPGVGVRAYANHPGTPGKDTWRRGARQAQPKINRTIRDETLQTWRKALR